MYLVVTDAYEWASECQCLVSTCPFPWQWCFDDGDKCFDGRSGGEVYRLGLGLG